ncbi:MAG: N-acetylmuramoyl-L-alanine amidase [Muribaculum sp.]|nr:N-acetylmuramoyl-L-alanine amidase [Muribaculum sp.]
MRKITKIIVHCTATPAGRNVTVREIATWHRQRGFNGIGYHYVVMLDGTVENGRPVEKIGAHCKGQNSNSIGVVYVGGLSEDYSVPLDTRTLKQRIALRSLISKLKHDYPGSTVHSHYEFAPKACPYFDAAMEYADL